MASLNKRLRRILSLGFLVVLIICFFVLDFKNEETYLNNKFDEPILNADKFNNQLNQESIKGLRKVESIDSSTNIEATKDDYNENDDVYIDKLPPLTHESRAKAQQEAHDRYRVSEDTQPQRVDPPPKRPSSLHPVFGHERVIARNSKGHTNAPYTISNLVEHFPVSVSELFQISPPLSSSDEQLPKIQYEFDSFTADNKRLAEIKSVFSKNWALYMKYAKAFDEIQPVSKKPINSFTGWGFTLIDSLDSLYIMGMTKEYKEAVDLVVKIDFKKILTTTIPVFETTIRILGGLIGAYDLSNDSILLEKAIEVGDLLMFSFDTPNRMPLLYLNWETHNGTKRFASTKVALAEVGSLSLEFTRLSQISNDPRYFDAAQRIINELNEAQTAAIIPGFAPVDLDISGCEILSYSEMSENEIPLNKMMASLNGEDSVCIPRSVRANPYADTEAYTLGGLSDSFYEYLIKQYILSPTQKVTSSGESLLDLYNKARIVIKKYLLFKPKMPNNKEILFTGDLVVQHPRKGKEIDDTLIMFKNQVNHLDCFQGGMFAIGAKILNSKEDLLIAGNLTKGCLALSDYFGVMPENVDVDRCDDWKNCNYDEDYKINWIRKHTEKGIDLPDLPNPSKSLKYATIDQTIPYAPLMINEKTGAIHWKVGNTYNQPLWVNKMDGRYLLRPELIESVFVMYRVTGDNYYREKGWEYFKNLMKSCEVTGSNGILSSIKDVTNMNKNHADYYLDTQESFLFAETLKYIYLLFAKEDVISLDDYVLNTEAHPFKRV